MPRVVISSGHTSSNPGTVVGDLREVELARKISKAALPHLRQNGVITLSVPPELDLTQRIDWINKTGYNEQTNDIAVEVHINDGGKSGVEIWYEGEGGNNSQKLAETILAETTAESKLPSQGARSEYDHELGSLAFLHESNPLTCLIECGYIDNESDAKFLRDEKNLESLGRGIAKGILKYLNIEYREPVQSVPAQAVMVTTPPAPAPASAPAAAIPAQMPRPMSTQAPAKSFNDDFDDDFFGSNQGFSGFPGAAGGIGGFGGAPKAPATGGFNALPSRDERKEMIKKNYIKILGREPELLSEYRDNRGSAYQENDRFPGTCRPC